jgi:muramoyltetrapeptide carboxypeptidase
MLKKIHPGATIAVIAPAYSVNPEKLKKGMEYIEHKGYKVKQYPSLSSSWRYFSAQDDQRAAEINACFADSEVSAIFCARGGWGSLRLLDKLNYQIIRDNPKALVGYSDITTLQLAIWEQCNIPSFSGPMVAVEMGNAMAALTEHHFWKQLNHKDKTHTLNQNDLSGTEFLNEGNAKSTLLGGCLSMISHLLGTVYCPSFENCTLFIEDTGEDIYKIDRYLAHLKQADVFKKIKGLIVGKFNGCEDNSKPNFSIRELIEYYMEEINGPVLFNFPYGHDKEKITLPIGGKIHIDCENFRLTLGNLFN